MLGNSELSRKEHIFIGKLYLSRRTEIREYSSWTGGRVEVFCPVSNLIILLKWPALWNILEKMKETFRRKMKKSNNGTVFFKKSLSSSNLWHLRLRICKFSAQWTEINSELELRSLCQLFNNITDFDFLYSQPFFLLVEIAFACNCKEVRFHSG